MDILFGYGVAFVFGLVIGVVIFWFYSMGSDSGKTAEELKTLKEENTVYRAKVDDHFLETAELFKDLTDRYREVYKHMAAGADSLCSEDVKKLQAELSSSNLLIDAGEAKPVEAEAEEVPASPEAKQASAVEAVETAPKPEAKPEATAESDVAKQAMPPKDHVPEPAAAKESAKQPEDKKTKKSAESKKSDDEDADGVPLASEVEVHPDLRAASQKSVAEGAKLH